MMYRITVLLLVSLLTFSPCFASQKLAWWRTRLKQRFETFDWNCASTGLVGARLRAIVARAIPAEHRDVPGAWGDRAVIIRLKYGEANALFVPTTCGATGNCGWRLYDSRTHRFLGALDGQFIFVRASDDAWPMLVTYTRMSACDGILARYEFRGGRYRWMKDDYAVSECGLNDTPMPRRLAQARRLCAKHGW